ncbi:hypothetical protein [Clostridium sp.]|uniref:hypothetical protein n=1 Tax=Clostridium sp. TaxID=1506 RepID=UPI002FC809F3
MDKLIAMILLKESINEKHESIISKIKEKPHGNVKYLSCYRKVKLTNNLNNFAKKVNVKAKIVIFEAFTNISVKYP